MYKCKYLCVCISGDGGGSCGPDFSYQFLKQLVLGEDSIKIECFDTKPSNIDENVDKMCELITGCYQNYQKIYIVGWSLGTVIAVNVVHKLSVLDQPININGLIMISPLKRCDKMVRQIYLPIGFIHGKIDVIVPCENVYYLNNKTIVWTIIKIYDDCGHLFTGRGYDVAQTILSMIDKIDDPHKIV